MAEMLSHREGRAYIVTTEGGSLPIEPLWNENTLMVRHGWRKVRLGLFVKCPVEW